VTTCELKHTECAAIGKLMLAMFDHWQLTVEQQRAVLGLDQSEDAMTAEIDWSQYLSGEGQERASQLLAIHASLRSLFPANPELVYRWIQTSNRAFNGATPLALIEESGIIGLQSIQAYLQQTLGR
jgi:hypothetical protein